MYILIYICKTNNNLLYNDLIIQQQVLAFWKDIILLSEKMQYVWNDTTIICLNVILDNIIQIETWLLVLIKKNI